MSAPNEAGDAKPWVNSISLYPSLFILLVLVFLTSSVSTTQFALCPFLASIFILSISFLKSNVAHAWNCCGETYTVAHLLLSVVNTLCTSEASPRTVSLHSTISVLLLLLFVFPHGKQMLKMFICYVDLTHD